MHTHHDVHSHDCMVTKRVDDHTVLIVTPSIHPNHTFHHHLCSGKHPHSAIHSCSRLLAPSSKRYTTRWTTSTLSTCSSACSAMSLACNHPYPLKWPPHCVSLARTLCTSHSGENDVWGMGVHSRLFSLHWQLSHSREQQATSSHVATTGWSHNQHHHHSMWTRCSMTLT